MKLTRLQRHTAYILMLVESNEDMGFCYLMYHLFKLGDGGHESYIKVYFPELFRKKPTPTDDGFWFPLSRGGNNERKVLLMRCISETY